MAANDLIYTPSKTVKEFMLDDSFFRGMLGPIGSGKSAGCCIEILRRCIQMPKGPDGFRHSRWAIIRNTRPQLRDTTLQTWFQWIKPGVFGRWNATEMIFYLEFNDIKAEILFRALDTPEDVQKVLSLEISGAWINECREIPLAILQALMGRIGRYPSRKDVAEYWCGLIADTNPPEIDSDWWKIFEHVPIDEGDDNSIILCSTFKQPSGLAEDAENKEWLRKDYYEELAKGKTARWIDVYIRGMYAQSQSGRPVYEKSFKSDRHVSRTPLKFDGILPVVIGLDCARTPAAVFKQMRPDGRIVTLREAVGFDMGADTFIKMHLNPIIRNFFPSNPVIIIGDPSWVRQNETDDNSWYLKLKKAFPRDAGHMVKASITNDPIARINATDEALRSYPDGEPLWMIDPACKWLIEAYRSKYRYAKIRGADSFHDRPEKNNWSHVAEANQYADMFLTGKHYHPEDFVRIDFNPLNLRTTSYRPADGIAGY